MENGFDLWGQRCAAMVKRGALYLLERAAGRRIGWLLTGQHQKEDRSGGIDIRGLRRLRRECYVSARARDALSSSAGLLERGWRARGRTFDRKGSPFALSRSQHESAPRRRGHGSQRDAPLPRQASSCSCASRREVDRCGIDRVVDLRRRQEAVIARLQVFDPEFLGYPGVRIRRTNEQPVPCHFSLESQSTHGRLATVITVLARDHSLRVSVRGSCEG